MNNCTCKYKIIHCTLHIRIFIRIILYFITKVRSHLSWNEICSHSEKSNEIWSTVQTKQKKRKKIQPEKRERKIPRRIRFNLNLFLSEHFLSTARREAKQRLCDAFVHGNRNADGFSPVGGRRESSQLKTRRTRSNDPIGAVCAVAQRRACEWHRLLNVNRWLPKEARRVREASYRLGRNGTIPYGESVKPTSQVTPVWAVERFSTGYLALDHRIVHQLSLAFSPKRDELW